MSFVPDLLPSPVQFFEREIGRLSRPNRAGWMLANCPFHPSKSKRSFAVHRDGRFYCFGCNARGRDLIAFVRRRDGCGFREACIALGCWADVDHETRLRINAARRRRQEQIAQAEDARQKAHRRRLDVRAEIHMLVRIQKETTARLDELHPGATPRSLNEVEDLWATLASIFEDLRETEREYCRLSGLDCEEL